MINLSNKFQQTSGACESATKQVKSRSGRSTPHHTTSCDLCSLCLCVVHCVLRRTTPLNHYTLCFQCMSSSYYNDINMLYLMRIIVLVIYNFHRFFFKEKRNFFFFNNLAEFSTKWPPSPYIIYARKSVFRF